MYAKIKSKILKPLNLKEFFLMIHQIKNFKIIAGGTDLLIKIKEGKISYDYLILITDIKELKTLKEEENHIILGAANRFSEILNFQPVKSLNALYQAISQIGSPQIRNMATIAGNIVNSSPAADSIPPLILFNSKLLISNGDKIREHNMIEPLKLAKDEILVSIKVEKIKGRSGYIKIGKRKVMTISRLNLAYLKDENEKWRFVVGAMTPYTVRMKNLESIVNSENITKKRISSAIEEDILSHSDYRPSFKYKMPVLKDLIWSLLWISLENL